MRRPWITVADFIKRYALYAAFMVALSGGLTSCDDKVEVSKYKNVQTTLAEYEPGKWKIIDEQVIDDTISHVFIKKLGCTEEEIPYDKVKEMFGDKNPMDGYTVDKYAEDENGDAYLESSTPNPNYFSSHSDNDLLFILWWSNYGYHLGRPFDLPIYAGYYHTPMVYSRAQMTSSRVVSSRTVTSVARTSYSAPIRATTNYGGGSARGYSSGGGRSSFGG